MKKGSIGTLLVVALVALGMMAFISLDSSSGAFTATPPGPKMGPKPGPPGPGPGAAIKRPVIVDRDVTVVQDDYPDYVSDTTGSDVAQIQLQCYIWSYDHPNAVAPVQIQGLCARFGVSV